MWWAELLNNLVAQLGTGAGGSASSFESIATVTAAGGETSLTLSSIPSTYKSLQIRGKVRSAFTGSDLDGLIYMQFNGDTATNYAVHSLYGNGASANASGSASSSSITLYGCVFTSSGTVNASIFGNTIVDIVDYANTSKNKTTRAFNGKDSNGTSTAVAGVAALSSGLWQSTAAINSINFTITGTFAAGSTFALYGIKG